MTNLTPLSLVPVDVTFTSMNVNFNYGEVRVILGRARQVIEESGDVGNRVQVEWFQTVSASPSTMKQLSIILARSISLYEAQNGEIHLPPEFESFVDCQSSGAKPAASFN
jgi:hypothetical protein